MIDKDKLFFRTTALFSKIQDGSDSEDTGDIAAPFVLDLKEIRNYELCLEENTIQTNITTVYFKDGTHVLINEPFDEFDKIMLSSFGFVSR